MHVIFTLGSRCRNVSIGSNNTSCSTLYLLSPVTYVYINRFAPAFNFVVSTAHACDADRPSVPGVRYSSLPTDMTVVRKGQSICQAAKPDDERAEHGALGAGLCGAGSLVGMVHWSSRGLAGCQDHSPVSTSPSRKPAPTNASIKPLHNRLRILPQ